MQTYNEIIENVEASIEKPFVTARFGDTWKEHTKRMIEEGQHDIDGLIELAWKQGRRGILLENELAQALTSIQSESGKGEEQALTPLQPNEKGETYTRSEVEGLLNKFCNEVMVGQSVGTIPKHSNGIAQYIIDNF